MPEAFSPAIGVVLLQEGTVPSDRPRTFRSPVGVTCLDASGSGTGMADPEPDPGIGAIPMLDLFAGAGGLSLGLSRAGLVPVAAVETTEDAAKTYEAAHDLTVDRRRVEQIPAHELRSFRGRVGVVAGGPPCQPWSTGGLRRGEDDERDGFGGMFRALDFIRPEAFIIENVAGLERGRTREYFLGLVRILEEELGYVVKAATLNAADYGVPQQRQRLFIVGTRESEFEFPDPSHGPGREEAWRTAGEYLTAEPVGDPNTSIVTYAKNPDLRPSPYDGLLFNGGGRPINLDLPARTILASAGGNKTPFIDTLGIVPEYHTAIWDAEAGRPREGYERFIRTGRVPGARRITVSESAALQTFPADMEFKGGRSSQYTQVGNAVPPDLASAVGRALVKVLQVRR
jgi:DNA (cytosine-5)-methyltransferase 1